MDLWNIGSEHESPNYRNCRCCGADSVRHINTGHHQCGCGTTVESEMAVCLLCGDMWTAEHHIGAQAPENHTTYRHNQQLCRTVHYNNHVVKSKATAEEESYMVPSSTDASKEDFYGALRDQRAVLRSIVVN